VATWNSSELTPYRSIGDSCLFGVSRWFAGQTGQAGSQWLLSVSS
jgi:hypothetical protein